ncbi:hypothetical protein PV05_03743 [Exophiala xenobiotica]|uniref:Uncharacterized protein n=1 Tax=Exophiala xenobiotica TaxID=348802 RepID=A0A0D2C364_9EURO|nr:uncharacterized protein PV05_03743 [Exophiala xenobiotica]KIW59286.1 hypothetical protein PV05_03743 [Exophiala xenobiotica]
MALSNLDYDILNNMNYVDDIDFSDFTLFPTSNDVDLDHLPDLNFFPDFDSTLFPTSNDVDLDHRPDLNFFPEFDFNPQSPYLPTPCSASSHVAVTSTDT